MNCAYHGQNVAVVNCNGCGKSLCPACDHRVKGFPYCQDCIVLGVQLLRNQSRNNYSTVVKTQTSPFVALILSLFCPGLGAAYNGQTTKALIYFAVFVGLIQMAILSRMPLFVFGFLGMWLYAAVDAWKTAKLLRSGTVPENAEDFIVQRFSNNPKLWGIVLLILGGMFVLRMLFDLKEFMKAFLPVALIIFGVYLLREYIFKSNANKQKSANYPNSTATPSFGIVSSETAFRTGEFPSNKDFETETRVRAWKNR